MAGITRTTAIRRRRYTFAGGIARCFTDSRRQTFLQEMLVGLVAAGHVHLTAIARGVSRGAGNLHAAEKRLSRHRGSAHWDMSPVADELLRRSAARVGDDTLLVADTTDRAKSYAAKLEGLGRVQDGSDPEGRIAPGYCVFEAYVRVGRWQLFPLLVAPLKVYAGAPTGEHAERLAHILRVHAAVGRQGTWLLDRGFDRRELFGPLVRQGVALAVRQTGERLVRTADGRELTVQALGAAPPCPRPRRWPKGGVSVTLEVELPEVRAAPFLPVVGWRVPHSARPLGLLVGPAARRRGRTGRWGVRAYHRRWGVEDATRGSKPQFHVEAFLVRSWRAIRRLLWLVAWAFWWLNRGGDCGFERLRQPWIDPGWRLPKEGIYLFDWIAVRLRELLHPPPRLNYHTA